MRTPLSPVLLGALFLALIPISFAASSNDSVEAEYGTPSGLFPLATQTQAWAPLIESQRDLWIDQAQAIAAEDPVQWSDALYLEYTRNGSREGFQQNRILRERRFFRLFLGVLATGAEGRWIRELEASILDLTNEPTWAFSAHDPDLNSFHGKSRLVDLGVALRAFDLAAAIDILNDRLDPDVIATVKNAIQQRVFEPYLDAVNSGRTEPADIWWMERTNNWNAVCHFGVIGAALILERDPAIRANFLEGMQRFLPAYIEGFSDDGYCSEGLSYWNYGFTQYVALAELVNRATQGRLDLLAHPRTEAIALYPYRLSLAPGVYPTFADGNLKSQPNPALTAYLGYRFATLQSFIEAPRKTIASGGHIALLCFGLANSEPAANRSAGSRIDPLRSVFPQGGVVVSRAGTGETRTAVAAKAGHNGEHHNHNDVGSIVVTVDGVPLIVDPGKEIYSQRTFGDRRYESRVLSSYGHSVPVVAGALQSVGSEFRGHILETEFEDDFDRVHLELREAYDVDALAKLERAVTHHRDGSGSVTMVDTVEFDEPNPFAETFITFGTFQKVDEHHGIIEGEGKALEIRWAVPDGKFAISASPIEERLPGGLRPHRILFELQAPVKETQIEFTLRPLPHSPGRLVSKIETEEKVVALTFDDGPEELSLQLIEILGAANAKATFFVVGKKLNNPANAEILRTVSAAGHEIGNHSFSHSHLATQDWAENENEVQSTQALIREITGKSPTLFRAPYLEYNAELLSILGREELTSINSSNSVFDWDPKTTVDLIIERGARTVTPGAVVLMHSWSEKTLEALPEILRILTDKGYRMVTVSELIARETK